MKKVLITSRPGQKTKIKAITVYVFFADVIGAWHASSRTWALQHFVKLTMIFYKGS